jgi:hypothetical protein
MPIFAIYTNPVHTSQETRQFSATEPRPLTLFGETVAVYCENRTEHIYIYTLWAECAVLMC